MAAKPRKTAPAASEKAAERECNVPGCPRTPEFRGLCGAHWATQRGLADPKEESSGD